MSDFIIKDKNFDPLPKFGELYGVSEEYAKATVRGMVSGMKLTGRKNCGLHLYEKSGCWLVHVAYIS